MSKIVLFVCLVLGTVYANTQVCVVNAQYDTTDSSSPALFVDLNDSWNVTTIQPQNLLGKADGSNNNILQASDYQTLPIYNFVIGTPLNVYLVNLANVAAPAPPFSALYTVENFTFVENQSYSFIYVAASNPDSFFSATAPFPGDMLIPFEERPNPSPTGKALVRIANVAVSTYNANMTVNVIGTGGVANRTVTVPFGEASDFLEYDAAVTLTLEFTLPLDQGPTVDRTLTVTTVVGATQVVYIRGDTGDFNHLGSLTRSIEFAFPAAPVAAPVVPPTAEPVSAPVADTPTAPVAATPTAPTTPTARTPVKRVSSAAQTVAQIAGVAALASLLF